MTEEREGMIQGSKASARPWRFALIDLLRFLAAFAVMIYHHTVGGFVGGHQVLPVRFPELTPYTQYGYLGVDLFFLISGFVILMTAMGRSSEGFLISRMTRLYPAFWASCTLTFLVSTLWGPGFLKVPLNVYAANMTMFHWALPGAYGPVDPVYWSLIIELKFYGLMYILLFVKQVRNVASIFGVWLIISLVELYVPSDIAREFLITPQSPSFIAGAFFYLIHKEGLTPYKFIVLLGCYILTLCQAMAMLTANIYVHQMAFDPNVLLVIITGFYGIFFLVAFNKLQCFRCECFIALGALTYPLYLLHSRIGSVILNNAYPVLNKYVLLLLVMGLALVLSWLVHTKVEVKYAPFLKRALEKMFAWGKPVRSGKSKAV